MYTPCHSLQVLCSVEGRSDICWLLQLEAADLEPYLANVHDKALKHSLQYGVGFLHETMSSAEQEIVNRLFNNGAIQVRPGFDSSSLALTPSVWQSAEKIFVSSLKLVDRSLSSISLPPHFSCCGALSGCSV